MASGARRRPRTARAGFPATTSRPSTAWRSTAGTTDPCPATPPSTCWAAASTAAFWCARARAARDRGPSRCATRAASTTTASTRPRTARWENETLTPTHSYRNRCLTMCNLTLSSVLQNSYRVHAFITWRLDSIIYIYICFMHHYICMNYCSFLVHVC